MYDDENPNREYNPNTAPSKFHIRYHRYTRRREHFGVQCTYSKCIKCGAATKTKHDHPRFDTGLCAYCYLEKRNEDNKDKGDHTP